MNNLMNRYNLQRIFFFIFLSVPALISLPQKQSPYELQVTRKPGEYRKQIKLDPDKKMVELRSLIPNLDYDLRYATANNFMHRFMYPSKTAYTFLRKPAAQDLQLVQKELNAKGLGLKIFDAYRPYSVTVKFWELVHDERYVANPAKGSGHNKGIAVDLTIINMKTGEELNMGTGFDNFTDSAHHTFTGLTEAVLQNRVLLKTTMEKYGFKALETEWWHYYLSDGEKYEVLDFEFKKLKRIN
ncbi:MAG: M15 family metallopeptidase [Chitinophagaceae bacterium]|nr:M15 family metallopeptidase [Chitinophagaceae bacterium]